MDEYRFKAILNGDTPTIDDYANFVAIVEKLSIEILWEILNNTPKLNKILRNVVNKTLQEKVVRKNVDDSLDAIVASIQSYLPKK